MDSIIANNQKRKKRKSRKRLNAIRKKALHIATVNNFHKGCDVKTNTRNNFPAHKTSIYITNNRLTLFNKAVTSDTVTRTKIVELKKTIYSKDYKTGANTVAKLISPLNRQDTNHDNNKKGGISCDNKNCNKRELSCKRQSSVILFSLSNQPEDLDISKVNRSDTNQYEQVSTDSSQINNSFSENKVYKEFLNKLPNYLNRVAPMLLNTDFLHKCKMSLSKLYMENYHFNIKDYSASSSGFSYEDTSQESINQNPTDDIECSYKEVSKLDSVSSPLCSFVSNSTMGLSTSPLSMVISDSPEYIYYPHRLNQ